MLLSKMGVSSLQGACLLRGGLSLCLSHRNLLRQHLGGGPHWVLYSTYELC